jgi:hypothetical protein
MPTPRQYATAAERQAAYRQRRTMQERSRNEAGPTGLALLPGPRRWRALSRSVQEQLERLEREMQEYYDQRSESWQESERGERHLEQLQVLPDLRALLQELWD